MSWMQKVSKAAEKICERGYYPNRLLMSQWTWRKIKWSHKDFRVMLPEKLDAMKWPSQIPETIDCKILGLEIHLADLPKAVAIIFEEDTAGREAMEVVVL